jgi:F-type H+-transporting ATPase subunit epsilon
MRLSIATPLGIVLDASDVTHVRAEDETGAFGILPGHADFLTTLTVSVVTWRTGSREQHVAVRGGVLTVRDGEDVVIATREAVGEETLTALGDAVLDRMRKEEESEQAARMAGTRMELAALRQIQLYLASGTGRLHRTQVVPASSRDPIDGSSLGDVL